MIGRKKKNNQAKERQELSPSDLAYFTPELKQAKIELDKRKNAMNDFFLQAMTQGIKIKLENERESQWRSVKDKLPKDEILYLVWLGNSYDVALYAGNGEWCMPYMDNITTLVTHWMPLPEPPKEDEDDD